MQNKAQAYALLQSGNLIDARKMLEKVIRKNKNDTESLMMLGYIYSQASEHNKSIQCLLKVTRLSPRQSMAFYNLGNAYKAKGDLFLAIAAFKKAAKIKQNFDICINLGNTLATVKQYAEAVKYLKQAVSINPDDAAAYYNLGRVLNSAGLLEESISAYEKAIALKADFFEAYNNMGNTCLSIAEIDKANYCYDEALRIEPDSLDALSGKLRLLDKIKNFDKAFELVEPHIKKKTEHAGLCATFADFAHYLGREEQALEWLSKLTNSSRLSAADKSRLFFLLGKILDEKKDYKAAFENYEQANLLVRQPTDFNQIKGYFSCLKNTFSKNRFEKYAKSTTLSCRPIFIVGMPRSGTSLVEQIIASHPKVAGAGELEMVSSLAKETEGFVNNNISYPKIIEHLSSVQLDLLAKKYLQRLDMVNSDAEYVTDKMPHNFLHLGFIQLLFPNCRIIHCRRNALDTNLSCYFQDFTGNHPYSNDLSDLAKYYRLYYDLMGYWQANLSLPIFNIDYEQLISNQETTSKQLIKFCQLDWHNDCLHFHKNKRVVSTASYDQVRQKIYSKSVERWRNYESFIQPLISSKGSE